MVMVLSVVLSRPSKYPNCRFSDGTLSLIHIQMCIRDSYSIWAYYPSICILIIIILYDTFDKTICLLMVMVPNAFWLCKSYYCNYLIFNSTSGYFASLYLNINLGTVIYSLSQFKFVICSSSLSFLKDMFLLVKFLIHDLH